MKWLFGWFIVFFISWGLGTIICNITVWRKNYRATKIAAALFFGLPVVFLVADLAKQNIAAHNRESAQMEVAKLCALDGGDKIYKTVDNVEGVLQMRYRKPRDYRRPNGSFYREIEDQFSGFEPYINAQHDSQDVKYMVGKSAISPDAPPVGKHGYWFVEQKLESNSTSEAIYLRNFLVLADYSKDPKKPVYVIQQFNRTKLKSRYGYLSEDLTTKEMREHWIGAGRIKIIDLHTNQVLAERKGYVLAAGETALTDHWQWYGNSKSDLICPNNGSLLTFLHSVLKPPQDFPTNEQLEAIAKD